MRLFFICFMNAKMSLKGSRQANPLAINESTLLCGNSAIVVSSPICIYGRLQGSTEPFDKRSFVHLCRKAPESANFEFRFINFALYCTIVFLVEVM